MIIALVIEISQISRLCTERMKSCQEDGRFLLLFLLPLLPDGMLDVKQKL